MARIALIEPAEASPEVKEIYEQKLKGKPGNVQKALAHRADRAVAHAAETEHAEHHEVVVARVHVGDDLGRVLAVHHARLEL